MKYHLSNGFTATGLAALLLILAYIQHFHEEYFNYVFFLAGLSTLLLDMFVTDDGRAI